MLFELQYVIPVVQGALTQTRMLEGFYSSYKFGNHCCTMISKVNFQRFSLWQETQLLPSVVVTEQQSLVVVKKLLAIAVSTITYLRGLFPEKAYGSKYVEGMEDSLFEEFFFF